MTDFIETLKKVSPIGHRAWQFGQILEMKGFTLEEANELLDKMHDLLLVSRNKEILLKAIIREGKLADDRKYRKKGIRTNKGMKYDSRRNQIVAYLNKVSEPDFESDEPYKNSILDKDIFELWTSKSTISDTTRWRIKKDLEERGIKIIEK